MTSPRTGPIPWSDRDYRWQQHYDEFMESIADEGRVGILTPIAAEQYADDMVEEEEQNNGAA